jgi:hypothetical protein
MIEFFEGNDNEYLNICKIPDNNGWPNMDRLVMYNLNSKYHEGGKCFRILYRRMQKILSVFSKIISRKIDYDFYGGANWTNYTHNCVSKIFEYLREDKKYIRRYWWTNCADEIFFQTIIHKLEDIKIVDDCLRYVDWENGPEYPRILKEGDYEKIISSGALFARKFDETIDRNIIEKIYTKIRNNDKI